MSVTPSASRTSSAPHPNPLPARGERGSTVAPTTMPAALSLSALIVAALIAAPALQGAAQSGAGRREKIAGYAEWKKGDLIVVDGQRIRGGPSTKVKGKGIKDVRAIPLGYEVEARGVRGADGILLAESIDAKANGSAMFEKEVRAATDELESSWLQSREVSQPKGDGGVARVGKITTEGADVRRVQRLMTRLRPPYVGQESVRVHVVQTKDWNAMAMGNGAAAVPPEVRTGEPRRELLLEQPLPGRGPSAQPAARDRPQLPRLPRSIRHARGRSPA